MEQLQQLLELLKQTPEMGLWALGIFLAYSLLKLASWVLVIKAIMSMFIKRYFDYRDAVIVKEIRLAEEEARNENGAEISAFFEKNTMYGHSKAELTELLISIRPEDDSYIRSRDIQRAIKAIKKAKEEDGV